MRSSWFWFTILFSFFFIFSLILIFLNAFVVQGGKRVFCDWYQVCLLQLIVGVQGSGESYFESLFCSPCRIYFEHGVWSLWAFIFVSGKWRWYFLSWRTGVQIWANGYKVYVNQILCSGLVCTLPSSDHLHPASPFLYSQWSASLICYLIKLFVRGVAYVPGRQRSVLVCLGCIFWVQEQCLAHGRCLMGVGWRNQPLALLPFSILFIVLLSEILDLLL